MTHDLLEWLHDRQQAAGVGLLSNVGRGCFIELAGGVNRVSFKVLSRVLSCEREGCVGRHTTYVRCTVYTMQ